MDELDWLIVMGGPMGIYDEAVYPWLSGEKEFIRQAIAANKVVLGICLGAQLIANALGAKVGPGENKEIGWFPVRKTADGNKSKLVDSMPGQLVVFHWHGDQSDIPANCLRLAESEACPNQILQYGDRVIGLQFHFEATEQTIRAMLHHVGEELNESGPFIQQETDILNGLKNCESGNQVMFGLLDRLSEI